MKNKILKSCWGGLLAGAMLLASPVPAARAQNTNLINLLTSTSWDCVLNGHRQGTALFTFNNDFTFDVVEVMVPNVPPSDKNGSQGGSRTAGSGGRLNTGGPTNVFVPNQQIFGSELTSGFWNIDSKGHVIGFFFEVSALQSCTVQPVPLGTNVVLTSFPTPPETNGLPSDPSYCITFPTTNGATFTETTICYTNVLVCTAITNAISFSGTVTSKRLNLKGTTPFGDTTYSGGPLSSTLPDISGTYWGTRTEAGVTFREFMTLTLDEGNVYDVALTGPGYTYHGISMLSSQKKIAFGLGQDPAIPFTPITVVRAVVGPFNLKNLTGKTQGLDGVSGISLHEREHFNVQQVP